MANATIRIITDTEAVILSKGADEALTGRLAYASDKKKLYVGNGTKFVVATDTDVAVDEAKDYTDTAIYEFGDQVYSKEVIDNKLEPITDDISEIQDDLTNIHDDINNLYTNDQIDSMLDEKADKADVYTKTEVDTALDSKVAERAKILPAMIRTTRQAVFDKVHENSTNDNGGFVMIPKCSWDAANAPAGEGTGVTGLTIGSSSAKPIETTNRWISILWQSQATGKLYSCICAGGVIGDWVPYSPRLYEHWVSYRLAAGKKFGFLQPIVTSSQTMSKDTLWSELQRRIGNGNETFHRFPVSVSMNWSGSGLTNILEAYVSIGGTTATANIDINLVGWNGSTITTYTESLGTVANATGDVYNTNYISIN